MRQNSVSDGMSMHARCLRKNVAVGRWLLRGEGAGCHARHPAPRLSSWISCSLAYWRRRKDVLHPARCASDIRLHGEGLRGFK
jgi:hypothetical protein